MTSEPPEPGPDADPEAVGRRILLDQLTGQARTRRELAARLAARHVPEEVATRLLDRFEEVGLVDDAAFADAWVASRLARKGLAGRTLAHELRRKGVPAETARDAVSAVTPEDEEAAARTLVRRRMRSVAGLPPEVAARRLVGMLARKGHSSGTCWRVVREELGEARGEDDPGDTP